ncbi:hypothetical protein DSL64_24630 [Dyadobacter luteus]|uniref:DUF3823 domain-containing protein n=1 Tax=Dyadobacter luteus TaxID=2259619 RepID=A0A3D8Y4M9_9BACT|nr:DUF3823 domain-containing protein [Dyadobacter luteus]REA57174.1 hypothetical protein DSL64_24630 [Dyadobacter luteus]
MKVLYRSIWLLFFIALWSCEKDNYTPPASTLTGSVVFNNQPVGLRSNGVQLELWQPGFPLRTKIPVHVDQDGSFSASVFDGNYRLSFVGGNGPWVVSRDSIVVNVNGNTTVDVPVKPYYVISNEAVTNEAGKLASTFNLGKIDDSRALQFVGLYIGTTAVLDNINNRQKVEIQAANITSLTAPVKIDATLSAALASREYVFARIGVKTSGVNEMIFSPVVKVEL